MIKVFCLLLLPFSLYGVTFQCVETLNSNNLSLYFPKNATVASFFSGFPKVETRLAQKLGITIDAYDRFIPAGNFPNIQSIFRDMTLPRLKDEKKYDRILIINPWIDLKIKSKAGIEAEKLVATFYQFHGEEKIKHVSGPNLRYAEMFDGVESYKLLAKGLNVIYFILEIAQQWLNPGGKVYLLTELFNNPSIRFRYKAGTSWSVYKFLDFQNIGVQVFRNFYPNTHISMTPDLKSVLLQNGDDLYNPFPEVFIEPWTVQYLE